MKDKIFGVLQRVGRSFMLPIAILPVAGLLLGIGSSFTNETTIATYGLQKILGSGTLLNSLLIIMNKVGSAVFDNLPLIFAVGVAIGMAKKEKEVAALSALIAYFVMNVAVSAMLLINNEITADGQIAADVLEGTITSVCGIQSLQMGVFGGIIVGLGVAALHNRFHKIVLPNALSFFGGSRFIPIISTIVYMFVGILMYFVWPVVQNGIYALGGLVTGSGYLGTLIFGIIKRALIPFGLHHVFYMPFWQTAVGGTMEVAGQVVQGGQNIFFAQLADPNTKHFAVEACRFMTGKYSFMMAGLPGAAYAMYRCAKPEKRKIVGGLLFSAALTSFLTGITEPIEFTFLFIAPGLFILHCGLAGLSFALMHILKICIGTTFSCGLIDFMLYGVLQGQTKSNWMMILPVFAVYAVLYYFVFKFVIEKFDLPTPGRDDDEEEVKLYTKADYQAKKGAANEDTDAPEDPISFMILKGLGGIKNIEDIDCCATRLRITVTDETKVTDQYLKQSGSKGIIKKGTGIQIIYGPQVSVIKSNFEEYVEYYAQHGTDPSKEEEVTPIVSSKEEEKKEIRHGKLVAVATGKVLAMTQAKDEAFATCAMGDGVVIEPEKGVVVAPADGKITALMKPSLHAIGIETKEGLNLLIHIGIDTVKLDGKGFKSFVKSGQEVKAGDKLVEFDIDLIKKEGYSPDVMVVVLEDSNLPKVAYKTGEKTVAGKTVVAEF